MRDHIEIQRKIEANRERASGRVRLGTDARLSLASVRLADIRGPHPALHDRDARLDLASGSLIDFTRWTPENLEVVLASLPMWCIERGQAKDRHFLVVCGGHLLPALRRALPGHTSIPVFIVDAKLKDRRWLEIAAVHAAATAALSTGLTETYVESVLSDAQVARTKQSGGPDTKFA